MAGHKDIFVQEYENRIKANPQSLVFSRLADSYRKRGDIQQAIDVCVSGLKNHPSSITGRIILGRCFLEQEKFKEAMDEFNTVVENDRRNHIALKMLADVHARQGMKEKAGDLYAYLRSLDPENGSIASLCENFQGSGETDIYTIIGLSAPSTRLTPFTRKSQDFQNDLIGDSDKTIPIRVGSDSPFLPDTQTFAQTMQFDAEELTVSAPQEPFPIEETINDMPQEISDTVTGDDISSRMSTMFEDESEKLPQSAAQSQTSFESIEPIAEEPSEVFSAPPLPEQADDTFAATLSDEISGHDISSRIEQLFGEEIDLSEPVSSLPVEALKEPEPIAHDADISGDDIVSRMSQLFESPQEALALQDDDEQISDLISDISQEIGLSIGGSADEPIEPDSLQTIAPLAKESPVVLEEDRVSGDEVAARLETIFEEEPLSIIDNNDTSELSVSELSEHQSAQALPEEPPLPTRGEPAQAFADLLTDEKSPEMSGDDVVDRLSEFFPDNLLEQDPLSLVDSIPDDGKDDAEVNEGFYTLSGENAQRGEAEETLLEHLDDGEKINFEESDQSGFEQSVSDYSPPQEPAQPQPALAQSTSDGLFSIPDHVLTPTLADIYFQQGQSNLAVEIYSRLLQRDPDNEKIVFRLQEIKKTIADGLAPIPPEELRLPQAPLEALVKRPRVSKAAKSDKPLAGVRIKKALKNKRK